MVDIVNKHLYYSTDTYIELFGGSAKILLNKPQHRVEIYNDIDNDIYNLFSVVKNRKDEFIEALNYVIYSEKFFNEIRKSEPIDDIEKAIKTFCTINMSFAGEGKTYGYCYTENISKRFFSKVSNIDTIYNRIKNVVFLNKNYSDVLQSIKGKKNYCIYADPPYYNSNRYYEHKFTRETHVELAWWLNSLDHKIILSYYYFPGIENLYPRDKWNYFEYRKYKYSCKKVDMNGKRQQSLELIITNFKTGEQITWEN